MKNIFLSLLLFIGFISCKKDENVVTPSLADQVAGKYNVSLFDWDGIKVTLPNKNQAGEEISANITIFRILEAKIDMSLNLITKKTNGNSEAKTNKFADLILKNSTTSGIDIYDGTTKVGSILNGNLNLNIQDNQSKFVIQAKKEDI